MDKKKQFSQNDLGKQTFSRQKTGFPDDLKVMEKNFFFNILKKY